ncbi:MAG: 3-deoxy-D-manno-octulosonic acid kinase [Pseudomonadota bacterium]|nr:MAG: 3-deoxy-D-manno-octulosonic acid kinase [Pseudomonadota bacterium]
MKAVERSTDDGCILYDADMLANADAGLFDPVLLQQKGLVAGRAAGRGTTWFVTLDGHHAVLRHYHRGGMVAALLGDRYLWTGLARTRAWREWHLLREMHGMGLPVPQPLTARVRRYGPFYSADIVTARIVDSTSLSQRLRQQSLDIQGWRNIGHCIRRFHEAGVYHADLNAHNILIHGDGEVYVIDFDRGRRRSPGSWRRGNLNRLRRSLDKLHAQYDGFAFGETGWRALLDGYDST